MSDLWSISQPARAGTRTPRLPRRPTAVPQSRRRALASFTPWTRQFSKKSPVRGADSKLTRLCRMRLLRPGRLEPGAQMRGSLSCSSANARRRSAETRRPPLEPNSSASPDHVTRPTRSARSSPHQPLTLDVHLGVGGALPRNAAQKRNQTTPRIVGPTGAVQRESSHSSPRARTPRRQGAFARL